MNPDDPTFDPNDYDYQQDKFHRLDKWLDPDEDDEEDEDQRI